MTFLLIDAGATKTDFTLVVGSKISFRYSGAGINPNYCSDIDMMRVFSDFVGSYKGDDVVDDVFYYGAGCASVRNASKMEDLISKFFPCANIKVYSDLVAVCHALSMGTASVVSIWVRVRLLVCSMESKSSIARLRWAICSVMKVAAPISANAF